MEKTDIDESLLISPGQVKSQLESGRAKQLSKDKFPYHNWKEHVLVTYEDVEELGKLKGLSQREIDLLKIAALYHDIALPEGADGHEARSAEIAEADLQELGFSKEKIDTVKKIILGTKGQMVDGVYVTEPSEDPLVLIMRDADMANVGKEDYMQINENLRNEWGVEDKKSWIESQIEFIKNHKFHTEEAEELWGEQKIRNLELLQERVEEF